MASHQSPNNSNNNNTSNLPAKRPSRNRYERLSGLDRTAKIDATLSAFEGIERQSSSSVSWIAKCPAHDDKTPSLSISIGREKPDLILIHCFAGCTLDSVLRAAGLTFRDLYLNKLIEGDR